MGDLAPFCASVHVARHTGSMMVMRPWATAALPSSVAPIERVRGPSEPCSPRGARRPGRSCRHGGMRGGASGWSVGWRAAAPGSLRRLPAAAGRLSGLRGATSEVSVDRGCVAAVWARSPGRSGLLTLRGVVLALVRRLGVWAPLGAHHVDLPRLAQARSLGAIASALTPMLATPHGRGMAPSQQTTQQVGWAG